MNYKINLTKSVLKELERIPDNIYIRIRDGINMLKETPDQLVVKN